MKEIIQQYRQLRGEVDQTTAAMEMIHAKQIQCHKGCCACCLNLSVWPVEFYSILDEMKAANWPKPQLNDDKECGYLDEEGGCQIYPFRPIICRTHGLPLVYWHDDTNPPGYGVMFCGQNFSAADEIDFGPDTTLNMDDINERLARINLAFLDENKDLKLKPTDRIELRRLLKEL